jgi:hypothetical protein
MSDVQEAVKRLRHWLRYWLPVRFRAIRCSIFAAVFATLAGMRLERGDYRWACVYGVFASAYVGLTWLLADEGRR